MSTAAIVGTGFMGRVHTEALARLGVDVVGVVGSSPQRAAAAGLGPVYDSLEEMLDDPRVDCVHICSPNRLHYDQAMAALLAGKHVVCEKPLGTTPAQAHVLRSCADDLGVVNAVCFVSRFYPLCQDAAARIATGSLGAVHLLSGGYLQDWLSGDTDWNWRVDPDQGGALRVVGDIGSHWLDLAGFLSGQRVEAVMADLTTVLPERAGLVVSTEDMAGVLIRYDGGARGVMTLSQVSPGRKNHLDMEISAARASVSWNSENPDQLWIGHRDGPNEIQLRAKGDYPPGHAQGYADAFKALFRAVYSAIEHGRTPDRPDFPTFGDGLEQVLIGEAISESARLGRWVRIER